LLQTPLTLAGTKMSRVQIWNDDQVVDGHSLQVLQTQAGWAVDCG
jgi:hypothetical protein